jgi:hypothetical protein
METLERTNLLKNRIVQHIADNTMYIHQELEILKSLLQKYEFKTITNYGNAQDPKLTYNGVLYRLKNKKCTGILIDNIKFICM